MSVVTRPSKKIDKKINPKKEKTKEVERTAGGRSL
jgi:hypothetical protein